MPEAHFVTDPAEKPWRRHDLRRILLEHGPSPNNVDTDFGGPYSTEAVRSVFEKEFGSLADKFTIFELSIDQARESRESEIWQPGVYVWCHPDHGGVMAALEGDKATRLLLFNVKNPEDHHRVAALESFFENMLHPAIASDRRG